MRDFTRMAATTLVFSSSGRDPRVPLQSSLYHRTVEETCAFYGAIDVQGCREPRRAGACLLRTRCVVTQGQCQDVDAGTKTTDFGPTRLVDIETSALLSNRFESSNTTICGTDDASCVNCGPGIVRWKAHQTNNSSVQCIGTSRCLCSDLVRCLDEGFTHVDERCQTSFNRNDMVGGILVTSGGLFVLLMCFWTILWAMDSAKTATAAQAAARRIQQQATRLMRHMLDHVPGDFRLDLFGWRQHQRHLRHKEQQLLRGYENLSPVAQPMEYAPSPSAPTFDFGEEASAPTKQDPMALASAPVFRLLRKCVDDEGGRDDRASYREPIATAPDFDA